jgi:hypothetical protein
MTPAREAAEAIVSVILITTDLTMQEKVRRQWVSSVEQYVERAIAESRRSGSVRLAGRYK